jgi:hypothetical protein
MSEEQGPPLHLAETNILGKDGRIELETTYIGKQPKPGKNPKGGGFSIPPTRAGGMGSGITNTEGLRRETGAHIFATQAAVKNEYATKSQDLPRLTEVELANFRARYPAKAGTPAQTYQHELNVRNLLQQKKTTELNTQTGLANAYYGQSPINKTFTDYLARAKALKIEIRPDSPDHKKWVASYKAAYTAKLLMEQIQLLNNQRGHVRSRLASAKAQEQRAAAKQARLAAEQEAQRVAAEESRLKAEAQLREQARLKALAETERLAAEKAQIAAQVAAQNFAVAQARLKEAKDQRELEALRSTRQHQDQRQAKEESRNQALLRENAVYQRQAEKAHIEARRRAETETRRQIANVGAAAASGPMLTVGAGTLLVDAATSLAIKTALRTAAATAITALAAAVGTASGVVIVVGVAALVYYTLRDNKEPYALSVPLSNLTTYDVDELHDIAQANGEIELPVAIGSRTVDNTTEFSVATTNGTTVPRKVPVRLAAYDPVLNVYRAENPNVQSPGMTWTPIVRPGNASTALPVTEPNAVPYTGATVTALKGRIDTNPQLDLYSFGGFIYVFPVESGIAPQYVMINSPYDGATVTGQYSGRKFNPEQAGGPILDLDWRSTTVTQQGTNLVKLHTARFNQSDANDIMIERLEKILNGQIQVTDVDLRYYTHELRELERYRAIGYSDNVSPPDVSPVWNNAHTATLEDYKLGNSLTLLYTETAINAMNAQDQREYEKELKEREE